MNAPSEQAIDQACRQLRDFLVLQAGRCGDDKRQAIELMAASVGMTPQTRELLARRLIALLPVSAPYTDLAWVLLGVTIGLSVAEHDAGRPADLTGG